LPVVAGQLANMMLGVVDTMMLGRVSVHALDASALGNLWQFGTLIFGMGVVFGVDPIVSRAHGAGDGRRLALALQRGILAGLLAGIPIALLWIWTEPVL